MPETSPDSPNVANNFVKGKNQRGRNHQRTATIDLDQWRKAIT